jgi:hypothetical protein
MKASSSVGLTGSAVHATDSTERTADQLFMVQTVQQEQQDQLFIVQTVQKEQQDQLFRVQTIQKEQQDQLFMEQTVQKEQLFRVHTVQEGSGSISSSRVRQYRKEIGSMNCLWDKLCRNECSGQLFRGQIAQDGTG